MRIRFQPSAADWEALVDFQLAYSPTMAKTLTRARWLAMLSAVLLAAIVGLISSSVFFVIVVLVAGVIAAFQTPRSVRRDLRKQMRAMYEESVALGAGKEAWAEVRAEGLATEGGRGTGLFAWSGFQAVAESPTHLYLGLGGASGIVIPKDRVLEGDLAEFATACRARIAPRGA